MRFHYFLSVVSFSFLAAQATAATNFTYQKVIPAAASSAINGRFTSMVGAPGGGLYVVSSSTDIFAYMPDPINDSYTSIAVATTGNFSTGNSFSGITVAPNGTVCAGGKGPFNDATKSEYTKAVPDAAPATAFTPTVLDLLNGLYSGPASVSNDTFVVASDADGGLTFIQNSSGSATTVLNGTAIGGGAAGAKAMVYDSVGGFLYQAASTGGSISGLVHRFPSNGTIGGTTAGSVYKAGVATTLNIASGSSIEQGIRYQSIAISTVARLLAVAQNPGPSPAGGTGWAIYDLTTGNQIDFINLGPSDVPSGTALASGVNTASQQAQGCAFVEKGGSTYLLLAAGSGTTAGSATISRAFVFKKNNANVSDWAIY